MVSFFQNLSLKHGLAVVIVNQVAANIHPASDSVNFFVSDLIGSSEREGNNNILELNSLLDVNNSYKIALEFRDLRPCLGLFWSMQINTRLFLTRTGKNIGIKINSSQKQKDGNNSQLSEKTSDKDGGVKNCVLRRLSVIFSPRLHPSSCFFFVTSRGIEYLEELKENIVEL